MLRFAVNVLVTLLIVLLILLCIIVYKMTYWRRRGISHTRPHLLYGNLKGVMEYKHFADIFREIYEQHKRPKGTPYAGFYMLCNPAVVVLDLELAKRILIKDFHCFSERGFFYNERDDPLTTHIFSLPTDEWRLLRSKLSPAFTSGKLKQMFVSMREIGKCLTTVVETQLRDHHSESTCPLELKDLYDRYTTDVIGTCIFGLECNSLQDPSTEFRTMNQNLFDNPRNHRIVDGLLYAFPKLARWLRLKQIPDTTTNFYFGIVCETLAYRERHNLVRNDFLQTLLELKRKGALTLNEIVANAFLFFFAGFETSSVTMSMALYELAHHPEYQERLRAEIEEKLHSHGEDYPYECTLELPYLNQVINETLRKHTIIPQIQRIALTDYDFGDTKYRIEKGTVIYIPVDAIHHDAEIYDEPEQFRPERFETSSDRHSMAWLPFGEGPRFCIGMTMAYMQMAVGLCSLLRQYKFSVLPQTPRRLEYYIQCPFLIPKSEIILGVERIK